VLKAIYIDMEENRRKGFFGYRQGTGTSKGGSMVPYVITTKDKVVNEGIPIAAHCSLEFLTTKDGKEHQKALCLDLYLENLDPPQAGFLHPWKVKNVEYKDSVRRQVFDQPEDLGRVVVTVRLPSTDADVWFEDYRTNQRGIERVFESAPLAPGSYSYRIRAKWQQDGKDMEETRTIRVQPGQRRVVDFSRSKSE
jgi:uncharacterized protein (TIGR03000 family)